MDEYVNDDIARRTRKSEFEGNHAKAHHIIECLGVGGENYYFINYLKTNDTW